MAKLWLRDGNVCYRIPGSVRTDVNGMVDRFKELFSLRMQSVGKKQLQQTVFAQDTKCAEISFFGRISGKVYAVQE